MPRSAAMTFSFPGPWAPRIVRGRAVRPRARTLKMVVPRRATPAVRSLGAPRAPRSAARPGSPAGAGPRGGRACRGGRGAPAARGRDPEAARRAPEGRRGAPHRGTHVRPPARARPPRAAGGPGAGPPGDELRRRLLPDARDAGEAVGGIAAEEREVAIGAPRDAVSTRHLGLVDLDQLRHAGHGIEHADVRVAHEREQIAVPGDDLHPAA